jgi:hypothetical protein
MNAHEFLRHGEPGGRVANGYPQGVTSANRLRRGIENKGVSGLPSNAAGGSSAISAELVRLASDVRRIGTRRGASPFDLLAEKEEAADRLVDLARRIDASR